MWPFPGAFHVMVDGGDQVIKTEDDQDGYSVKASANKSDRSVQNRFLSDGGFRLVKAISILKYALIQINKGRHISVFRSH